MSLQMSTTQPGVDLTQNDGPSGLAVNVVTRALATTAVLLRFLARRRSKSGYWWDDWLILTALIILLAALPMEILMITRCFVGRHIGYIQETDPKLVFLLLKYIYADSTIYPASVVCIKNSILFLYLRLFGIKRSLAWACYIQIGLVITWGVIGLFFFMFRCSPAWAVFSPSMQLQPGRCFEYSTLFVGTNTINVIMDFGILITPLPCIWSLKLSVQRRVLLSGVLMVCASELAFSIIRVVKLSSLTFEDVTWDTGITAVWSNIEVNIGILCACIPVMAPLLPKHWLGRGGSSHQLSDNSANKQSGRRKTVLGHSIALDSMQSSWRKDEGKDTSSNNSDDRTLVTGHKHMGIERTLEFSVHNEAPSTNSSLPEDGRDWPYSGFTAV